MNLITFFFTQLKSFSYCYKQSQFNISHLLAHNLFYLTHRFDAIRGYHSGSELTSEQWQWRATQHFLNLQGLSLAIRLFNVISRTLIGRGGSYYSAEMQSVYSIVPVNWAVWMIMIFLDLWFICLSSSSRNPSLSILSSIIICQLL